MSDAVSLHEAKQAVCHAHMRLDLARNTRIFVTPNVNGHVHITIGVNDATLILHPHAAKRLIANIQAVLDAGGFASA